MPGEKRGRKRKYPAHYSVPLPVPVPEVLSSDDEDMADLSEAHEQHGSQHHRQEAFGVERQRPGHDEANGEHRVTFSFSSSSQSDVDASGSTNPSESQRSDITLRTSDGSVESQRSDNTDDHANDVPGDDSVPLSGEVNQAELTDDDDGDEPDPEGE